MARIRLGTVIRMAPSSVRIMARMQMSSARVVPQPQRSR